jgi:hypothetical protein
MNTRTNKLLLTVAFWITGLIGYCGSQNPVVKIKEVDNKSFALYITSLERNEIQVFIKNDQGSILTEDKAQSKEKVFARKFNLRELQAGTYTLEIVDNIMTRSYPIEVSNTQINVIENKMIASFKPVIRQKEGMVGLMVFSPAQQAHEITIYNENFDIVHDETLEKEMNIQKKFDFTTAAPGDYSIVINTQGHKYTYSIPVK